MCYLIPISLLNSYVKGIYMFCMRLNMLLHASRIVTHLKSGKLLLTQFSRKRSEIIKMCRLNINLAINQLNLNKY